MTKFWICLLVILFLGASGVAGWMYYEKISCDRDLRIAQKSGEKDTKEHGEELSVFAGKETNFSFDYPASWGKATETITNADDSDEDIVAAGKTFEINFANNPFLTISGASPDFETEGIGGVCPIRQYFNGQDLINDVKEDYKCANAEDTNGEVVNCEEISINKQDGYKYYYLPEAECALKGIEKIVYLSTGDDNFPGLVMQMRIVWPEDLNIVDLGEKISSDTGTNIAYLTNNLNEILQDIEDAIVSEDYPYLPNLQINQLEDLIASLKFNE